jgi:DNA-binding response OmpR family regulator
MAAEYIHEQVWGQSMEGDFNAVKTTVYSLRKKLKGSGYTITNDRGKGYCFEKGEDFL